MLVLHFLIPPKWGVALWLSLADRHEQKWCRLLLGISSLNILACFLPLAVVIMMCVLRKIMLAQIHKHYGEQRPLSSHVGCVLWARNKPVLYEAQRSGNCFDITYPHQHTNHPAFQNALLIHHTCVIQVNSYIHFLELISHLDLDFEEVLCIKSGKLAPCCCHC